MRKQGLAAIVIAAVGFATTLAGADISFIAFRGYEMYQTAGVGPVDSASIDLRVVGAHTAPEGFIYGSSPDDGRLYQITGAGSLNPQFINPVQLSRPFQGLTMIGDVFYAFTESYLAKIDPNDGYSETLIGDTGKGNIGGAAYDAVSDTLYMISNVEDTLYSVSRIDGTATAIGSGLGVDSVACGTEFVDGVLYALISNADTNMLEFGTIDLETGAFSFVQNIAEGAEATATSLAIVPNPATGVLMFLGWLTMMWRPRRHA